MIEQLKIDLEAAKRRERMAIQQCREEAEAAASAVRTRHKGNLDALRAESNRLDLELRAAIVNKSRKDNGGLEGRKVVSMVEIKNRWSHRGTGKFEATYGVLEICTPETSFGTQKWGRPELGQLFVRLLKKDGKPGTKFAFYDEEKWKPADA